MTETEILAFVEKFQIAWATRSDAAFTAIWWPQGELHYPFADRVILGAELPVLNQITKTSAPDLQWRMIGWTARGDTVVVEWECSNSYGGHVVTWRGVDRLTLKAGRILEEVVYADTAPFQAMRRGERFDALMTLPERAA